MAEPVIAQKASYPVELAAGDYWWCACGLSKTQPFCDGSHKGTEFGPSKVEITEAKQVAWCMCKHSQNGAHCDGSHKRV